MGMMSGGHSFASDQQITPSFGSASGATGPYHLPVSNLPSEFRLDSSSKMQLPQVQKQASQVSQLDTFTCLNYYIV